MKTDWKADAPWLLLIVLATTSAAWAEDESEPPVDAALDMEFLEYLGSWEDSDDEWMLFAGDDLPADARTDPAPEREESEEKDDEG